MKKLRNILTAIDLRGWIVPTLGEALVIALIFFAGRESKGQELYPAPIPGESVQGYVWPVRQPRVIAYPPGSEVMIFRGPLNWIAPRLFPPEVVVFVPNTSLMPMAHSPIQSPPVQQQQSQPGYSGQPGGGQ